MDIVMNRLVLGLLAMTPVLGAQTRAEVVPLQQRSLRDWQIALPNETWVKIGSSIDLASHSFAVRAKGTGVGIDTDADGEINVVVQDKSGFVKLRDGSYRYAIELANRGAGWFYRSAVVKHVDIHGTKLRLIDQDGNGRFLDFGVDAMIVGRGDVATFLSRAVNIDGQLLHIEAATGGQSLRITPFTGATGMLDLTSSLDTKGKLLSAVVQSSDGEYSFDLARGALLVPAASYRIHSGAIGLGKTTVGVKRGRATDLVVGQGSTAKLDWGGPARAEFAYRQQGDKIQFRPDEVWYYGSSGEEYGQWRPVGKSPRFDVIRDGEVIASAIFPGSC